MLSPQQKTTTLVKILFRAAHSYSKDSKKRCPVNWSKNRANPIHTVHNLFLRLAEEEEIDETEQHSEPDRRPDYNSYFLT